MTARVVAVTGGLALLALLLILGAPEAIRAPVAAGNLLLAPGLALAPLLGDPYHGAARVPLTLATSLAVDTLAVTALLVAGAYSPAAGLAVLSVISLAGCAAQLRAATTDFEVSLSLSPGPS
jgi:hypothetical protein